jgi:hypothetical protein
MLAGKLELERHKIECGQQHVIAEMVDYITSIRVSGVALRAPLQKCIDITVKKWLLRKHVVGEKFGVF